MNSFDKYVYPSTTVLINKFNCRDAEKIREITAFSSFNSKLFLNRKV